MIHNFKHGFSAAPNEFLKDKTLSSSAKICLTRLIGYDGVKSEHICPKIATLAEATGLGPATVKRCLKELKERGLIVSTRRGKRMSNIYDVIPQSSW